MPDKHVADRRPTFKAIKFDQRVVIKLGDCNAEVLFRQLILEQDNLGRHEGDATKVKESCLPLHHWISEQDVEEYLQKMHDIGLVFRYKVQGKQYLQLISSINRQGLVGNMVRDSGLPPPPRDSFKTWLKDKRRYDPDFIAECVKVYIDNPKLDRAGRPLIGKRPAPAAKEIADHIGHGIAAGALPWEVWEQSTGRPITPTEGELIGSLVDQYGNDRVNAAIQETVKTIGNRVNIKYIEKVLANPGNGGPKQEPKVNFREM